jgi:tripartite-type tricarboxylate transporter receptor subunit TctC
MAMIFSRRMTFSRRSFLLSTAGLAAAPFGPKIAEAESYPWHPIRFVVPFPAGGVSDIVAREIGQLLSERLGQPLVIEDRGGAGSNLGTEVVVRSPPDGYTILLDGSSNAVNATLSPDLNFVYLRDITPVASVFRAPHIMEVNPSFPAQTIPDFIAYAKVHPREVNMASSGIGTLSHMAGELFAVMTGIELTHVPYRGAAPALTDMLGGQVHVMFDNAASSIEHVRAGRLHGLGVTTTTRVELLPDVPSIGEVVPGYEVSNVNGVAVPVKTPDDIVVKLNSEIDAILADSATKARFGELGGAPMIGSPADYKAFFTAETEKWAKVVKAAGLKPG